LTAASGTPLRLGGQRGVSRGGGRAQPLWPSPSSLPEGEGMGWASLDGLAAGSVELAGKEKGPVSPPAPGWFRRRPFGPRRFLGLCRSRASADPSGSLAGRLGSRWIAEKSGIGLRLTLLLQPSCHPLARPSLQMPPQAGDSDLETGSVAGSSSKAAIGRSHRGRVGPSEKRLWISRISGISCAGGDTRRPAASGRRRPPVRA
jgi:hypothetical protein